MEHFGQNFGYILYRKELEGNYSAQTLFVEGVHDIAYLRINGKVVKNMTVPEMVRGKITMVLPVGFPPFTVNA